MKTVTIEVNKIVKSKVSVSIPTKRLYRVKDLKAFRNAYGMKVGDIFLIRRVFEDSGTVKVRVTIFDVDTAKMTDVEYSVDAFSSLEECDFCELERVLSRHDTVR